MSKSVFVYFKYHVHSLILGAKLVVLKDVSRD